MKTQGNLKQHSVVVFVLSLICLNTYVSSCGLVRGSDASIVVWANDGGDKVTRDELRAYADPSSVVNSVWDGEEISLFGARNEVVSFNLVIEAPGSDVEGVEVQFDQLDGPGGASIKSRPASGDDLFNFVGRNIELFYVRYLEIEGLSTDLAFAGFYYDERHIPERFQLPYQGYATDIGPYEGIGTWEVRPDHNKFYPDIAVPLELESPFTINAGTSQAIWGDIYIPKTTPTGDFSGSITISVGGAVAHEIPLVLSVRDFMLPDLPSARTMLFMSYENVFYRNLGNMWPAIYEWDYVYTEEFLEAMEIAHLYYQLVHRHKISVIDGWYFDESLETPINEMMRPRMLWLTGELYTPHQGYEGIGMGVGENIFSISTYGGWPWQHGTEGDMWNNTDDWVNWLESQDFGTPTEYFLYLIDESDNFPQTEQWAQWMDNNPGPGSRLMSMATISLPDAVENTPSLDIPTSAGIFGITHLWQDALENLRSTPGKKFFMYNGQRPATGTFATEDDGVSPRVIAWTQYKMGVDRWFYWESTYYDNFQGGMGQTNVFQKAQTFGSYDRDDIALGKTGWNYFNGDGVLIYPGTDTHFPEESYDVKGPFASLRLKHWRRGIQDHDYLTLAAEIDPERTAEIVEEMIPVVLWEVGVEEEDDPSWVYSDISWSTDPDVWEAARAELADIIESGAIDTDSDGIDDRVDTDDDNDGMPDSWEIEHYFNHLYSGDGSSDADKDGVTNLEEYLAGSDPREQTQEPIPEPEPEPEPEPKPPYYDDSSPPEYPVKLIFIHHSCGENWLTDGDGDLGTTLDDNNYFVSDTNYGWGPDDIGDNTDYHHWYDWFVGPDSSRYLEALYNENGQNSDYTRTLSNPGGENEIVMFKSCYPNSDLGGSPNDPPSDGDWYTVGHAKYVYNQLLDYFETRPDKLFVVITPPPLLDPTNAENARSFSRWLAEDWLAENDYPYTNVAVWDLHNVLTHPDNHHRFQDGEVEYTIDNGPGTLYYDTDGDEHPNDVGNRKATGEFVTMLNVFYNRWRAEAQEPEPETDTIAKGDIIVQVSDEEHDPLSGATVYSTSQPTGQSSLNGVTSSDGTVEFNDVKPGSYVLRAMMSGYESAEVSGGVESGETVELTIYLSEEEPDEETDSGRGGWIPGFPTASVALGVLTSLALLSRLTKNTSRKTTRTR